ncbi:unnamed protein product [Arctia plantaginis]|uniref:Uncharacterized protein n=1 Tax=Arctia plantaginis TaxID=874455 RepID=A0A8S0YMQ7_ARCPL|nr:unnamed protein product [Arctia plantaginis]
MPLNPRDEGANKGVKTRAQRAAGTTDVEEGASPTSGHAHIGTSSVEVSVVHGLRAKVILDLTHVLFELCSLWSFYNEATFEILCQTSQRIELNWP